MLFIISMHVKTFSKKLLGLLGFCRMLAISKEELPVSIFFLRR